MPSIDEANNLPKVVLPTPGVPVTKIFGFSRLLFLISAFYSSILFFFLCKDIFNI